MSILNWITAFGNAGYLKPGKETANNFFALFGRKSQKIKWVSESGNSGNFSENPSFLNLKTIFLKVTFQVILR